MKSDPSTEARKTLVATLRGAQSPWMHQAANEIEALAADLRASRERVAELEARDKLRLLEIGLCGETQERLRARVAELEAPGECNSIHKLQAMVMELEAELLNERGEGTPPSEGWAYVDTTWRRDGWRIYRYDSGEDVRWLILLNGWPKGKETTARAAMKAANAALTGSQS